MNEEILNNIWITLSNDPDVELEAKDFEEWKKNFLTDPEIPGNVYRYLREKNLTDSSPDEWVKNISTPAPVEEVDIELQDVEGVADETSQPGVIVPEIIGEAPELTAEELASYRDPEVDIRVEEEKRKGREGKKSYLLNTYGTTDEDAPERANEIKRKTGLLPDRYPELVVGTQTHPFRKGVGGKPVEVLSLIHISEPTRPY